MSSESLNAEELKCLVGIGIDMPDEHRPKMGFWRLFELGFVDIDVDRDTVADDEAITGNLTEKGRERIRLLSRDERHAITDDLLNASLQASWEASMANGVNLGQVFNLLTGWSDIIQEALNDGTPLNVTANDLHEFEQARENIRKLMDADPNKAT